MKVFMITSVWPEPHRPLTGLWIKQLVDTLQEKGIEVDVFPYRGHKNPFIYARMWLRVRQQLRRKDYDLIHAQFGNSGILALPKTLPYVVTFHGSDVFGIINARGEYAWTGYISRKVSRMVARFADARMIVSAKMLQYLPRHLDYKIVPTSVDLERFYPIPKVEARAKLNLPQDKPIIFFGADPAVPRKRIELAQAAVELVRKTYPDIQLITGGNIPFEQMPLYMNACDALILTSIHEGSPTVVKEALACGRPIVSVPVGDVVERLSGISGCVVTQDAKPEQLASALEQVLAHPQRLDTEALRPFLSKDYEAECVIQAYQAALKRSIS